MSGAPECLTRGPLSWRQALACAQEALERSLGGARRHEAIWLARASAERDSAAWWTGIDDVADPERLQKLASVLARRCSGEPLSYVLGRSSFCGLELKVGPGVLVPRPETEVVVEEVLAQLATLGRPAAPLLVADLGTGSGAMALAVAAAEVRAKVWAVERSEQARRWASRNIRAQDSLADRVTLLAGSWFGGLPEFLRGRLDLVMSNPPYVSAAEMECLGAEVADWEPHEALAGGVSGLEPLEAIVAECPSWLARPGVLVVEVADSRGRESQALAVEAGASEAHIACDLAGRQRVLVARWNP